MEKRGTIYKLYPKQLIISPDVREEEESSIAFTKFVVACLDHHLAGEWGDVRPIIAHDNNLALEKDEGWVDSYYRYRGNDHHSDIIITTKFSNETTYIMRPETVES